MSKDNMQDKWEWKREYSVVLLLNFIYILIFYLIMTLNN